MRTCGEVSRWSPVSAVAPVALAGEWEIAAACVMSWSSIVAPEARSLGPWTDREPAAWAQDGCLPGRYPCSAGSVSPGLEAARW